MVIASLIFGMFIGILICCMCMAASEESNRREKEQIIKEARNETVNEIIDLINIERNQNELGCYECLSVIMEDIHNLKGEN